MKRILLAIILSMIMAVAPFNLIHANTPVPDVLPIVTGDFLQGWQFAPFSRAQIAAHINELAEAGIRYLIINDSARIENGIVTESYFPTIPPAPNSPWGNNVVEYVLSAAQNTDIRVFVGLAYDRTWWQNCLPLNINWYSPRAELGNALAQDVYNMFKHRYPDAFYGWYFPHEFFNNKQGQEWHFANFFNINRDFLYDLNPSMPMLISPFFASDHTSPATTRAQLINFFTHANFRDGDIYAPQDCVGVGRATIAQSVEYFRVIKEARDQVIPGLRLWANNENFMPDIATTAPLSRFIDQMVATNPYVEKHITFSYSHYFASLVTGTNSHHQAYLAYRQSVLDELDLLFGDVNGDGIINAADITLLRRYLAADDRAAFRQTHPNFNRHNATRHINSALSYCDVEELRRLLGSAW